MSSPSAKPSLCLLPPPAFTPNGGQLQKNQPVTLTCSTEGAVIYYTTDGSEPTAKSTKYTEPFTLTQTTTVKAVAIKENLSSEVVSATFDMKEEKPAPTVKPGVYSVPVQMMHASKPGQNSMGNAAIDGPATVTVDQNGKVSYAMNFKGIEFSGLYGHLVNLWHYPDFEANNDSQTGTVASVPSNPYTDTNLEGKPAEFYKTFTVTRDQAEHQFYIRISVDAMAGFDQDAILAFDWDNAAEALPAMTFEDVQKDDWFYPSVEYVYQTGMMNGITDTLFKPNANTTRAQIVTILHRLEGEPQADPCSFTDVKPGQWFFEQVSWASANGIVNGYPGGSFAPNKDISREQMAAILYRYAESKGYDLTADADLSGFADAGQINNYAKTAMNWAVTQGLMNGVEDTRIAPKGQATRAQIATLFMRFNETFVK